MSVHAGRGERRAGARGSCPRRRRRGCRTRRSRRPGRAGAGSWATLFERGQPFEPDRAARVQLVGGDADLRAEAVLVAVGEARRRVHHDRARIDFAQEAPRARRGLR